MFIWRQEQLRSSIKTDSYPDRVLRINYEDLIFDYEITVKRIFEFAQIPSSWHVEKFKSFNPAISKSNVGLWGNHKLNKDIILIEQKLSKYLYN